MARTWADGQRFERTHGMTPATCKVCGWTAEIQEDSGYVHRWTDCDELIQIAAQYAAGKSIREIVDAQHAEVKRWKDWDKYPEDLWTYSYVHKRVIWASELGKVEMRQRGRLKIAE